jgi:hypothetical protein
MQATASNCASSINPLAVRGLRGRPNWTNWRGTRSDRMSTEGVEESNSDFITLLFLGGFSDQQGAKAHRLTRGSSARGSNTKIWIMPTSSLDPRNPGGGSSDGAFVVELLKTESQSPGRWRPRGNDILLR